MVNKTKIGACFSRTLENLRKLKERLNDGKVLEPHDVVDIKSVEDLLVEIRDLDIMNSADQQKDIAKKWGISPARVCQIRRKHERTGL